jgi:hypothetical protein
VALLRQEIKELQEGISYRRNRATPEHRGLYDVLEENLVAGNQELEGDMDFFTTSERKERTFGKWIAGVLGHQRSSHGHLEDHFGHRASSSSAK